MIWRLMMARIFLIGICLSLLDYTRWSDSWFSGQKFGVFYATISDVARPDYTGFTRGEALAIVPLSRVEFGDLLLYGKKDFIQFSTYLSRADATFEVLEGQLFVDGVKTGNFDSIDDILFLNQTSDSTHTSYIFREESNVLYVTYHGDGSVLNGAIRVFTQQYTNIATLLGYAAFLYLLFIQRFVPFGHIFSQIRITHGIYLVSIVIHFFVFVFATGFWMGPALFAAKLLYFPMLAGFALNESQIITAVLSTIGVLGFLTVLFQQFTSPGRSTR